MKFIRDEQRRSDSPLVETIWQIQSVGGGSFMSVANSNLEMVITKQKGVITFTLRGPETKATPAPIPEDAEFLGITFKLGTFMPCLPADQLVNGSINLPEAAARSFWMQGSAWQFPNYENADTFIHRLVRAGLIAHDPVVPAALNGQLTDLSPRSVQRRFRRATGVTHDTMYQIERARRAMTLLQQGVPILDTVEQAGYYDQQHLTRSLRHLIGQTPAQLSNIRNNE